MKIHILTDNRTKKRGFLAEQGLSIFIEHENINVLFDTGQTDVFSHNARQLGVDLKKADCIVLSHGHYDHCGGLIHFPDTDKFPKVYVHEAAFEKRYALSSDTGDFRAVGIPWSPDDCSTIKNNLVFAGKMTQLARNVSLLGEISDASFEGAGDGFYTGEKKAADTLRDEQMLIIDTFKGLCIFLGCSHPGIASCLYYALKQFPGKKIYALVAGMHLDNVGPLRRQIAFQTMLDLDIQKIIPLHCTGISAICEMQRYFGNRCLPLCAGDTLEL